MARAPAGLNLDRWELPNPARDNPNCELYLNDERVKTLRTSDLASAPQRVRNAIQRFRTPPEFELYDLETDPWEFRNLAGDPTHTELLDTLKKILADWQQRTDDPLRHVEVLRQFTAETDAVIEPDGTYRHVRKEREGFRWHYPDYFISSMRPETRATFRLEVR